MDNMHKNTKNDNKKVKTCEKTENISPVGEKTEATAQHENRFK